MTATETRDAAPLALSDAAVAKVAALLTEEAEEGLGLRVAVRAGATLNYTDGLEGAGFSIENPNTKSSCGCGKSFN